jgi:hypothetical protein
MICCCSKNIEKRYAGILKMFVFNDEHAVDRILENSYPTTTALTKPQKCRDKTTEKPTQKVCHYIIWQPPP